MQIREVSGLKFYIRPDSWDENVVNAVVANGEYEVDIKKGDTVVDIGGHIGSFSILAASKGASVVVYEPCRENYGQLVANIALNGFESRIEAHNAGVGGNGEAKLKKVPHNMGSCVISKEGEPVTLVNPTFKCDVIKIDCEGCEYKMNIPKVRELVMELHQGYQQHIIGRIRSLYRNVDVKRSNSKGCYIIHAQ